MGCVVRMTLLAEEFHYSNVHANLLDWALQLMYDYDQLLIVISSSGMVASLVLSHTNQPYLRSQALNA
jgi:hypothetical protein